MSFAKSLAATAAAVVISSAAWAASPAEDTAGVQSSTTQPVVAEADQKQSYEQKQECKKDKNGVEKCKEKTSAWEKSPANTSANDPLAQPGAGSQTMPR